MKNFKLVFIVFLITYFGCNDTTIAKPPLELKNWSQIKQSKTLRVLKLEREEESSLPRSGASSLYHFDLVKAFAEQHNLTIEWVKVDSLTQLFTSLKNHHADVIPRNLTITNSRKKEFGFTHPLLNGKEILVGNLTTSFKSSSDKITVSLPKSTAYIDSVEDNYPHWNVDVIDRSLNAEEIADAIVSGKIKYSILDQQDANSLFNYRKDIKPIFELTGNKHFAWATEKNNLSLLTKLNEFISLHHAQRSFQSKRTSDLSQIKKTKQSLRVITRNSPETYFLWRGELAGFEYELMKKYADEQGLRLEIIVADSFEQMSKMLAEGQGDLIAAGLSRTQQRRNQLSKVFSFSSRYYRVSEMLIAHKNSAKINNKSDLKGRTIGIRKSSSFFNSAKALEKNHGAIIQYLDEELPTELIIEKVANKELDLTMADSNLVSIEQRFRNEITSPLTFKKSIPYAYIVRKNNNELLSSLNRYIKKIYRGTFYNVVKNKYFGRTKRQSSYREHRIKKGDDLSPYDSFVRQTSKEYQFDWRLITAQMFQESRFNPKAKSHAGALGLMQVLPRTAKEFGYEDLANANISISAGVTYLDWTRKRFLQRVPVSERNYFALAAYNAGFGHVRDAQRLAKERGLNPNKWFNNVEKTMLLLQQPKYYKKARYGYCRGSEPVNYVRNIQQRYLTYSKLVD